MRASPGHGAAARAVGFELAGVAAILITVSSIVSSIVGLRAPAVHAERDGGWSGRTGLTIFAQTAVATLDTDTTQRARKPDSTHHGRKGDSARRPAPAKAGTLSQDSLAKRRDAAARARHKPSDSIKAHRAPPEATVVP